MALCKLRAIYFNFEATNLHSTLTQNHIGLKKFPILGQIFLIGVLELLKYFWDMVFIDYWKIVIPLCD